MPLEARWPVLDWVGNTVGVVTVNPERPPASVTIGRAVARRDGRAFKVAAPPKRG